MAKVTQLVGRRARVKPRQLVPELQNAGDAGDLGSIPGPEDPLEKEMATYSSILAWRLPWRVQPGRLPSMESKKSDMIE